MTRFQHPSLPRASLLLLATVLAPSCAPDRPPQSPSTMTVFVSIPPQKYFLDRIAGPLAQVEVLIAPGQSHHTYEATPRQIAGLHHARAYFRIGVPFEKALAEKIAASMPNLDIIDTSRNVPLIDMHDDCDEPAESSDAHHHDGGKDPHIWLDPQRVKIQARDIADALIRLDPAHTAEYTANLAAFHHDLDATDAKLRRQLAPFKGRDFYVFHPAYGYLADAYGLKQVAVETGGKEPSLKGLTRLIQSARRHGAKVIFVQPEFPTAAANSVAEAIGGRVIPLDPLATDYLQNLEHMAKEIAAALAPQIAAVGGRP